MRELESNGVEIYKFPVDDETVAEINSQMNVRNCIIYYMGQDLYLYSIIIKIYYN